MIFFADILSKQPVTRNDMNELPEIYKRIEYLRNKGVKMKEIADHTNMAASVLSSLYSSVLPTYIGCIKKGNNEEEALDYALSQVNNVSKKRLLGNLKELKERLYELEPAAATGQKENPFLDMISEEMLRSVQDAYNYSGIYISYSLSSSTNALKVEPYLITTSENNDYVKVIHMSAYNTTPSAQVSSAIIRIPTLCSTNGNLRKWPYSQSICNCPCTISRTCSKASTSVWIITATR